MSELKTDCRHFEGSKPCSWNKKEGAECPSCTHYDPPAERILIIKLDAMGDVLRSTCILPKLKDRYPRSYVVWITRAASADLINSNPAVDEVWELDDATVLHRLTVQKWDQVYNLDNSASSSALASVARAGEKTGFVLSDAGIITPTNAAADAWLAMAVFDRCKQENLRSYQEIMYSICGFEGAIERPQIMFGAQDEASAHDLLRRLFSDADRSLVVGINTGSGGRWPLKMMNEEGLVMVCRELLSARPEARVLLLGGPQERAKNQSITAAVSDERCVDAGCDHTVLEFAALVGACRVVLCGDTLALHVATALAIPALALFCPTSTAEIYDYDGLIEKMAPEACDCLCSYNASCRWNRDCINDIPPNAIVDRLVGLLTQAT